jgi:hypothetical protein
VSFTSNRQDEEEKYSVIVITVNTAGKFLPPTL